MTHGETEKRSNKVHSSTALQAIWSSGSMTSEATRGKEKPFSQTRVCLWSTRKTHQGSTLWSLKKRELDEIRGKKTMKITNDEIRGFKWPRIRGDDVVRREQRGGWEFWKWKETSLRLKKEGSYQLLWIFLLCFCPFGIRRNRGWQRSPVAAWVRDSFELIAQNY